LTNVKASELEGITSPFVGRPFTDSVYLDLLNKVFALNYFENVSPEAVPGDSKSSTVIINLNVTEYPMLYKITFRGNGRIKSSSIKEVVKMKEKDIYDDSKRLIDERSIRNYYIEKGYSEAKISSSYSQTDKGIEVVFDIIEGQQTVVTEIGFKGNEVVSSKTLKGKISLKEAGLFNKGEFQEATVEQDRKVIAQYYKDRGYVDIKVDYPIINHNYNAEKQRDELSIIYDITEGSRYRFGGITFEGNQVFTTEELQALVKLDVGDIYNETSYQASFVAVQSLYMENGYTYNQFASTIEKNTDDKVISYVISIYENSRSHIEEIVIRGNNKTKEYVIRREIPIESGDVYSNEKLYTAMRNLYNLQYFSSIQPEVSPGSENNLIDVVFNFEEQSTTALNLSASFSGLSDSSSFPLSGSVGISDSNLFGTGKNISLSGTLAKTQQSISASYGENWLFGKPISTDFSVSYTHGYEYTERNRNNKNGTTNSDDYYLMYQDHIFSLGASLGRRWTPDFATITFKGGITGSLIYNIYDEQLYTPVDSSVSDYANEWEPKNSIWTQFSMDGRDISYEPSKGWFVSQKLSWYGLLPNEMFGGEWGEKQFYLRTDTKAEKYFTLLDKPITESWNLKFVLAGYSGISFEFPVGDRALKSSNLLYIDGMYNGRGWNIYSSSEGRGKAMWNNSVELRMPVIPNILAVDFFADASMIKQTPQEFFTDMVNPDNWYFSFGPDARLCIQQFPVRLMWAEKFKITSNGVVWCDDTGAKAESFWKAGSIVFSINVTNN